MMEFVRLDDDLLWDALDRSGWGLRWLRHVVVAAVLAGFGGLLWPAGGHLFSVGAFCGAAVYAICATAYWLRDRRRLVRVTVVGDEGVRIRMHRVSGRTTDHEPRMVRSVHITYRGHCYDDLEDSALGTGSATLRLRGSGLRLTGRAMGLDSGEVDRVRQFWLTACPEAKFEVKRIPGQFAGYSY